MVLCEKDAVAKKGGILLANLLQSSRSTFSGASSPSFFAFKEGIWDPQISALLSSPTVSGGVLGHLRLKKCPVENVLSKNGG